MLCGAVMSEPTQEFSDHEERLDAAIAAYYETLEGTGQPPATEEFLARYPDLQPELVSFLANKELFDQRAGKVDEALAAAPTTPAAPLTPGLDDVACFGDYRLEAEIARGGMGVVYRARQLSLRRPVALKMILAGRLASPAEAQRFRAEAAAAANLDHPNIVPIYEVGEHNGRHYFAMKLVEGGSLAERLAAIRAGSAPRLTDRAAARLVATAARAVQHAHQRGLLHRDLKPANILLDEAGQPLVTDFGLVKRLTGGAEGAEGAKGGEGGHLTRTGSIVGTPSYMAPEQAAARRDLTTAVDVYSLGAILYELLTGRPPFDAPTPLETLLRVRDAEPAPPRTLRADVPRDLATICLKCLHKEPAGRYASAAALADDLERWLAGAPIAARPVGRTERVWRWCRRNPALAVAGSLAIAALGGAMVLGVLFAVEEARAADEQARAADDLRKEQEQTRAALAEAQKQRRQAQKLSATLAIDHGVNLCAQGNVRHGLLWLARSLELLPTEEPNLEHLARSDLAVWGCETVGLRKVLDNPTRLGAVPATSVAVSPDGRLLATGDDQVLRLWDAVTGQPRGVPIATGHAFWGIRFSPDGTRLLTGFYLNDPWQLWDAATGKRLGQPFGQDEQPHSAAFSPDGRLVLTCGLGGKASLWNAQTGARVRSLQAPDKDKITAVTFSPDGRTILGACSDHAVRLWETVTGQFRAEPIFPGGPVTAVAYHPAGRSFFTVGGRAVRRWDAVTGEPLGAPWEQPAVMHTLRLDKRGHSLCTIGDDRIVRVWDTTTGKLRMATPPHQQFVRHIALSPDGRTLVTCDPLGLSTRLQCWDTADGAPLGTAFEQAGNVWDLTFTPDSRSLLVGGQGARLWDVPTGRRLTSPLRHDAALTAALLSRDGKIVVTAAEDGLARSWDAATGQPLGRAVLHHGTVDALAITPDGKTVLSLARRDTSWRPVGGPGEVCVWDAATGKPAANFLAPTLVVRAGAQGGLGPVTSIGFSRDGGRLLAGAGLAARVWDTRSGQPLEGALPGFPSFTPAALRPDGKAVAVASGAQLRLLDPETGQPIGEAMNHAGNGPILAVQFSPDGKTLATAAADYTARLWDAAMGRPRAVLAHPEWVQALAFSRDGKRLLTGCGIDGKGQGLGLARLWDVATGKPLGAPLVHRGRVVAVAISSDGKRLLTGSRDGTARLWDAGTAQPIGAALAHRDISAVAFAPDSAMAATAGADGTARIWKASDGTAIGKPMQHDGPVTALAFAQGGKMLATTSKDRALRRWDAATGKALGDPVYHAHEALCLAVSPDGKWLVTGTGGLASQVSGGFMSAEIRAWDAATGRPRHDPVLSDNPVDSRLVLAPDGQSFITFAHSGGGAQRWATDTGRRLGTRFGDMAVHSVAYSPDGKLLLTGGATAHKTGWRATLRLWDAASCQPHGGAAFHFDEAEKLPGIVSAVSVVAFRPDGKAFLTASGKTIRLWETATGRPLTAPLVNLADVTGARFSPDGRRLVVSHADRTVRLRDAATGAALGPPLAHGHTVMAMAFSPDGRTLATAGGTLYAALEKPLTGYVQLWDVATARPLGAPLRHRDGAVAVAFRHDGRALLSASRDGSASLWSVPPPIAGDVAEVKSWAEARSGWQLDADGTVVPRADERK